MRNQDLGCWTGKFIGAVMVEGGLGVSRAAELELPRSAQPPDATEVIEGQQHPIRARHLSRAVQAVGGKGKCRPFGDIENEDFGALCHGRD